MLHLKNQFGVPLPKHFMINDIIDAQVRLLLCDYSFHEDCCGR